MISRKLSGRLMHSTALCLALSMGAAHAQDAADTPVSITTVDEDDTSVQDKVVVTGSRIARDEFSSPVAIDVLTADEAKIQGLADLTSLLQTSTAASGSAQINAAVSNQFVSNGGTGAETLSLRGLGANRTLFLLNGRRAGPSGTRGSVSSFDLNSIPLAAVERVEILKDGASAVYGSDAIAGVVNIITKKSDGGTIDGFISAPEKSGGEEFRLSGSYGQSFDRGSFRVTADYFKRKELARGDRDYLDCDEAYAFNADGSRADVIDPRTGEFQCRDLLWGQVWIYDYQGATTNIPSTFPFLAQYDYDGSLAANLPGYPAVTVPGQLTVPSGFFPIYYDQNDISGLPAWNGTTVGTEARGLVDFDHPFQDAETLVPEVERFTIMVDGEYNLTDNIAAYGEALFNRRETISDSYRQYWTYQYGSNSFGGAINPEPSAAGWTGNQWFSPTAISDRSDEEVTVEYTRFVGGLRGEFDNILNGLSWDIAYQYSDSQGEYTQDFIFNDAVQDYFFQTTLCGAVDVGNGPGNTSVTNTPCVDVPWFDPELLRGNISQEVEDFLFTRETGTTDYTQSSIEGYITGDIFELPAGTVRGAIGFLYQEDEINDTPAGIVLAGNAWGGSSAGVTAGKQTQTGYYGELDIPLLKDLPLIESLTVSGSGRVTDISTVEETGETYRVALNWQMTPELRFRATQGTSFRAPGLFELFLADETSSVRQGLIDPCINWANALNTGTISQTTADNCAADGIPNNYVGGAITASLFRGGGLGFLKPETSDNFSAGFVWTPGFADLQVAVDYFDIEIKDEISTLSAANIVQGCYASEVFATEPLCDRFDRNAPNVNDANRITDIRAQFININSQINKGVDVTLRYIHETPFGDLVVDAQATHQSESFTLLLAEDDVQDFNGEFGEPKNTGYVNFTLDTDTNWDFFWGVDYIGATNELDRFLRNNPNPTLYGVPVSYRYQTEAIIYHTISTQYTRDDWTVRLGVSNLFDEQPPAVSASDAGNSLVVSQYDYLGRRVFLNVSKAF